MDPAVKGLLGLGIDVSLADEATESGLDMGAGTAEAVVQVQMTESRVQIISPKQAYHAAAEPNALRIASRAGQDPLRGRGGTLLGEPGPDEERGQRSEQEEQRHRVETFLGLGGSGGLPLPLPPL